MLMASTGQLARRSVHAVFEVRLTVRSQSSPVKAGGVILARRTKLARCHCEWFPFRSIVFRTLDECAIVSFDIPMPFFAIRAFTCAHGTFFTHQLVRVVSGPVSSVPVVEPHVVEVISVRHAHFAAEYQHARLVSDYGSVPASAGRAEVTVKTAITEGQHLGEHVGRLDRRRTLQRSAWKEERDEHNYKPSL